MLVRAFAQQGCQQLQLNSLNVDHPARGAEATGAAQEPDCARLGWSGYFATKP